jgi:hypothetical protein
MMNEEKRRCERRKTPPSSHVIHSGATKPQRRGTPCKVQIMRNIKNIKHKKQNNDNKNNKNNNNIYFMLIRWKDESHSHSHLQHNQTMTSESEQDSSYKGFCRYFLIVKNTW